MTDDLELEYQTALLAELMKAMTPSESVGPPPAWVEERRRRLDEMRAGGWDPTSMGAPYWTEDELERQWARTVGPNAAAIQAHERQLEEQQTQDQLRELERLAAHIAEDTKG